METIIKLENATYKLNVDRMDYNHENPFKDWDCSCPVLVDFNGFSFVNDHYQETEIQKFIESKLTYGMVKYHIKKFEALFNLEWSDDDDMDSKFDAIHYEIFSTNELKVVAEVCDILKIENRLFTSRGYCQGDYATVLCVITDEFVKITGIDIKNSESIFNSAEKLFHAWTWGDVYEYSLYKKAEFEKHYKENGRIESAFEWEIEDSCSGFYGDDLKENGILDMLPDEIAGVVINEL